LINVNAVKKKHESNARKTSKKVMKFLASITFLAAIPTIISSIYGMNFRYLPLAWHPFGFWISIGLMAAMMAGAFLYFRKRGWV